MDQEQLQNLFDFLDVYPFIDKINPEDQKKYDLAFEELQKEVRITNKFFIEKESFIDMIRYSFNKGAEYLKIHLIKETEDQTNIGFSFSNSEIPEDGTIKNDLDLFLILNNNQLKEISRNNFEDLKKKFKSNTLTEIFRVTNKNNTEFVKYKIEYVIRYMIRNLLSNTFNITGITFNQFIFKDYDNVNIEMNDRIGISVHTVLEEVQAPIQKNIASTVSIGYDFGTVYP